MKFHLENFLKYKGKLVISLEFFARGNVQKFLVGNMKNETSLILCKKKLQGETAQIGPNFPAKSHLLNQLSRNSINELRYYNSPFYSCELGCQAFEQE